MPREHTLADQALVHVLTEGDEHFADLVGVDGSRSSLRSFASSHAEQQSSATELRA